MIKKLIIGAVGLFSFALASCAPNTTSSEISSSEDKTSETSTSSSSSSSSTSSSSEIELEEQLLDFYAINDFHGRIVEKPNSSAKYYEPGIAKTAGYLNTLKTANSDGYVLLNSGDMFQDTYDSSNNKGELLAKSLPLMDTEAMAIGNHEFDWGIDCLKHNREISKDTAYLGANIYHYDEVNKKALDFASELADPYKIIERRGFKIGIIGVIGHDQITSITSTITTGYTFLDPTQIVLDLSDKLRVEDKCDLVIVSAHADYSQLGYNFTNSVASKSNISNKKYVDAVFTAHSHKYQTDMVNGVPFLQSGAHGASIGHIQFDMKTGYPEFKIAEHLDVPSNSQPDPKISELVDSYLTPEFYEYKNTQIGTIEGCYSLDRKYSGQMFAMMTYEELIKVPDMPQIDVVLNNGGRSGVSVDNGIITRGTAFDAMPFTNKTCVVSVKGRDIQKSINYKSYGKYRNQFYAPNKIDLIDDEYYTVAIIDYMLYHINSDKELNYFPSFNLNPLYVEERVPSKIIEDYFASNNVITWEQVSGLPEYTNIRRG